jgi:putative transposase
MNHDRRKIGHFNITDAPTPAWTAQQIINAFPYDTGPKYLLRDRDAIYGALFVQRGGRSNHRPAAKSSSCPWSAVSIIVACVRQLETAFPVAASMV